MKPHTTSWLCLTQQFWYMYSGLCLTTSILFVNICLVPWASQAGILYANRALFYTNVCDLIFVGNLHWKKSDFSMIFHHTIIVIFTAISDVQFVDDYSPSLQACCYWLLFIEITTWCNSVRYLVDSHQYPHIRRLADITFGIVFLILRSLSSVNTLREIWRFEDNDTIIYHYVRIFWWTLTCLHLYWGEQIIRKSLGYPRHRLLYPLSPWRRGLLYIGVGLFVIDIN